jgi:hypothetical protein
MEQGGIVGVGDDTKSPGVYVNSGTASASTTTNTSVSSIETTVSISGDQYQRHVTTVYILALCGRLPIDYNGVGDSISSISNEEELKRIAKLYFKIIGDVENTIIDQKKRLEELIEKNANMKKMFIKLFRTEQEKRRRNRNKKIQH